LAIYTGIRQGEILGLRWSDIDFENMVIRIRQTLSHDGKEFKAGAKTSSGNRAIAISTKLLCPF
jgi:integrase